MLVRQVIDPAEQRQMRVHDVLSREVGEGIIFDVEVRTAEIQFFPRINKFRLCRQA